MLYLEIDRYAWQLSKWRHERPHLGVVFDRLDSFIYELAYPKIFDTTRAEAALGGPMTKENPLASLHEHEVADRAPVGAHAL